MLMHGVAPSTHKKVDVELDFNFRIEFRIKKSATIFVGGKLLQALSLYGYNLHDIGSVRLSLHCTGSFQASRPPRI